MSVHCIVMVLGESNSYIYWFALGKRVDTILQIISVKSIESEVFQFPGSVSSVLDRKESHIYIFKEQMFHNVS